MFPIIYMMMEIRTIDAKEYNKAISTVKQDLVRLNLDPGKITIEGDYYPELFLYPTVRYTNISRFGDTSKSFPGVFFVDGLQVQGSCAFRNSHHFSVRLGYKSFSQDIRESRGKIEHRISPELDKLENYLLSRNKGEILYTYRSVREVRR